MAPDTAVLTELEAVLARRRDDPPTRGSYSSSLVADPQRAQRKIMEEAFELCLELGRTSPDPQRTAEEAADLLFALLAGIVGARIELAAVLAVLRERRR